MLSISGSFLDKTEPERDRTLVSPEASPARGAEVEVKAERGFNAQTATARQQVGFFYFAFKFQMYHK